MRFIITAGPGDGTTDSGARPFDEALMAEYMRFNERLHRAGVLLASEGLSPNGKSARIGIANGRRVVLDGPFAETKELIGGFFLIQVASFEEAVAWALQAPTGLGSDAVLTLHQMTELEDIPEPFRAIALEAAPTWSASVLRSTSE